MIAPAWQRGDVKLYLGDARELLPQFEPGSVDAVVTDPPYGVDFHMNPTMTKETATKNGVVSGSIVANH